MIKVATGLTPNRFAEIKDKLTKLGLKFESHGDADGTIYIMLDGIIIIDAKKWFDRVNGNTYHNVKVAINGQVLGTSGMTYGYGNQYMYTAFETLAKFGIFEWEKDETMVKVNNSKGEY